MDRSKLKEILKQLVYEMLEEDAVGLNTTGNAGAEYSTKYAFKKKTNEECKECKNNLREELKKMIDKAMLNENYSKFRNEIKFRTKSEQLHKAIKEVRYKLNEIDRLVEYTSRMKQELSEGEEGIKYWKATSRAVGQIAETITQLSNKIKNLNQ